MGIEKPHSKVKLVLPVLFSNPKQLDNILNDIISLCGNIDYQSPDIDFTFTDYYNKEMGNPITRRFYGFKNLIEPEDLVDIKLASNRIEKKSTIDNARKVNLDPGYLELGKFILATTKDQQHRIYIRNGIFEEITLFYRDGQWRHWEWTYPDFRSEIYKKELIKIRNIYKKQLNEKNKS
jgi:hypothetical protein